MTYDPFNLHFVFVYPFRRNHDLVFHLFFIWLDFIEILEVDLHHLESFMDHTE